MVKWIHKETENPGNGEIRKILENENLESM
jgi:hypothetical protein